MKNNFSHLILVIFTATFLSSCVKDLTETVYTGKDLIEFYPISKSVTTTTAPKNDSILVQLVGKQRTVGTKVNFTINAASTAVVTTDYVITTPSPVTIPANSSSVWIKFTLNKVSAAKKLIVDLTDGDNVTPNPNFKTFTFSLN